MCTLPWRSCCCAKAFKVKPTAVLSHCIGFLVQDRSTGILRFASADIASKALEEFLAKAEDQQTMAGTKTTWRKVEGEEEEKYYDRVSHGSCMGKGGSASSAGRCRVQMTSAALATVAALAMPPSIPATSGSDAWQFPYGALERHTTPNSSGVCVFLRCP